MSEAAFLAVDWGSSNRRTYVIDSAGAVLLREADARGILAITDRNYAEEAAWIRDGRSLPLLCAGMVGSANGWRQAAYVPCPADLDLLAQGLCWVEPGRTAIVPGVAYAGAARADVMRGEEVQLLGAVAAGLAPADGLFCQPGTHCKWAEMQAGRIRRFRTTMTGEIFALLRRHSLLAEFLDGAVTDGPAFRAGVAASAEAALLGQLFGARAGALLGTCARADIAAHVSGLLIGSDVREQRLEPGQSVHLLSDATLGPLYAAAIEAVGARPIAVDSEAAFVAGMTEIWRRASHAGH